MTQMTSVEHFTEQRRKAEHNLEMVKAKIKKLSKNHHANPADFSIGNDMARVVMALEEILKW